ncbi:hypothetical protein CLV59_107354 [Chitinophaga dinghuensis]|uniref:Uncharacterized protein n=1 Tax=Chitinophaga dinghuensis TaxID=1539050 RepID=A0A327VT71_9BACT|nr:hypothetical protein [Chitinophaga dinghuensis]RAJ77587.1 hypothetical protein CLV59_107354 [Chitinophaga dinghuensis]
MPAFNFPVFCLYLLAGLLSVTIIDTVGSILSRKLQFKYSYLSILSFVVYFFMGYLVIQRFNVEIVIAISALLGIYDGTVGLWLSIKLNANTGYDKEKVARLAGFNTAFIAMVISLILGVTGSAFK